MRRLTVLSILAASVAAVTASSYAQSSGTSPSGTGPSSLPACLPGQFHVRQTSDAGLGTTYLALHLRNHSQTKCLVHRNVRVFLLGPNGKRLLRANGGGPRSSSVHRVKVGHGRVAVATIGWANWCRDGTGPYRAELVLPHGGGSIVSDPWGPATCTTVGAHASFFLNALTRAGHR